MRDQEVLEIQDALRSLTRRVAVLEARQAHAAAPARAERAVAAGAAAAGAEAAPRPVAPVQVPPAAPPALGRDALSEGFAALETAEDVKAFPRFFAALARADGLRMLLLKRWNARLDILAAEGLPPRGAGERGREIAPDRIAVKDDDLFAALALDHCVYAGPVPIRHFPLDLSLLLGPAQDRRIVVLPLPLRGRWNTFVYLDADNGGHAALAQAELLARYALARLLVLEHGEKARPNRSATILQQELARRAGQERAAVAEGTAPRPATRPAPARNPAPEPPRVEARAARAAPVRAATVTAAAVTAAAVPIAPATQAAAAPSLADPMPGAASRAAPGPVAPIVAEPTTTAPGRADPAGAARILADRMPAPAAGTAPVASDSARSPAAPPSGAPGLDPARLAASVGDLPALPRVANHILGLIADPATTATKLEKAIVLDQALTAKILRVANSSFYGGLRDVNTVWEAIVRLGFVTIRNWTLATAARSAFLETSGLPGLQQIWKQSVLSAMASQLVAEQVRYPAPETVFVGGLMQNVGQLALAKAVPEIFEEVLRTSAETKVPYHVIERDLLGFDHGDLGALLIREWNLSDELEEAVRRHHRLEEEGEPRRLAAIIALGEEIADCSGTVSDEGMTLWEMSVPARVLGVAEPTYVDLVERARRLRVDPRLFA